MFKNKILLITGGTGSFGNAMLNKFLDSDIKEIRIFSRDVKFFIGDVRDIDSVKKAVKGVDYIFHAAALKQVPSCEFFPIEAVKTNILGTENVLESAIQSGVKKIVILSTDKAVYPINAMGLSKALMEKVMIAKSREIDNNHTVLCGTRYGNVMGSRGSVIPLFVEQIKNGQNITITDPNMTRYMMTLDDSVDLVIYAFKNGKQGDIFVQKSPAATIKTLAPALQEIYNANNKIRIIGTRHGEKLYETLVNREEMTKAIDLGNYYRIPADTRDLNYNIYFTEGKSKVEEAKEYTSHNTKRLTIKEMKQMLLKLDFIKQDINNMNK